MFVYIQVWEVSISEAFPGKGYPLSQEAALVCVSALFLGHLYISVYKGTIYMLHNLNDS